MFKDQLNVTMEAEFNEKAEVINAPKKDTTASTGNQVMDMMKKFSGAAGAELNGASAAFTVIPSGKKVGDTWSDSLITDAVKTYTNYTFKALEGKNATIISLGQANYQDESRATGYGNQYKHGRYFINGRCY